LEARKDHVVAVRLAMNVLLQHVNVALIEHDHFLMRVPVRQMGVLSGPQGRLVNLQLGQNRRRRVDE
jgi:hypothetical protein